LICASNLRAQKLILQDPDSAGTKISIGVNGNLGFFIANQPKSLLLQQDHAAMGELNISWQTTGRHEWEAVADYPVVGIGLIHGDAGSKQYIGRVTAIYPYIHFPLIRKHRSVTSFRLGTGIGYVQKPYHKDTNFKNLMIGTNLNATISMRIQTEWAIGKNLSANAGLNFTHLSNGSIRLPNLGLNIPGISLGLRYGPSAPTVTHLTSKRATGPSSFYIHISGAFKQTYPLESEVVFVPVVTGEWSKTLGKVSRINAGAVVSFDRSLRKEIANIPTYEFVNTASQIQASIYGGYEHVVGNLSIPIHFGVYLYNNYPVNAVYQVIGVRYRFQNRWVAAVQLKTHFGKADYIQYGIGYRL
jgi:hypothetical protein